MSGLLGYRVPVRLNSSGFFTLKESDSSDYACAFCGTGHHFTLPEPPGSYSSLRSQCLKCGHRTLLLWDARAAQFEIYPQGYSRNPLTNASTIEWLSIQPEWIIVSIGLKWMRDRCEHVFALLERCKRHRRNRARNRAAVERQLKVNRSETLLMTEVIDRYVSNKHVTNVKQRMLIESVRSWLGNIPISRVTGLEIPVTELKDRTTAGRIFAWAKFHALTSRRPYGLITFDKNRVSAAELEFEKRSVPSSDSEFFGDGKSLPSVGIPTDWIRGGRIVMRLARNSFRREVRNYSGFTPLSGAW